MTSLLPNEFIASLMLKLTGLVQVRGLLFRRGGKEVGRLVDVGLAVGCGDVVEGAPGDGVMP